MSVVETTTNIVFGMGVGFIANTVIFSLAGVAVPLHTNLSIVAALTGVSFVRQYSLRRFFENYRKNTDG